MPIILDATQPDFETRFAALLSAKREDSPDVDDTVAAIIADVRARGDAAVIELTASSFQQIGILRFGILGAYFQAMLLFLCTLLAYFDLRLPNLGLQTLFLVTNGLFTLACLEATSTGNTPERQVREKE